MDKIAYLLVHLYVIVAFILQYKFAISSVLTESFRDHLS